MGVQWQFGEQISERESLGLAKSNLPSETAFFRLFVLVLFV